MIDIHVHILPGLDDGASDVGESLDMCRMAFADGIKTMVATPHMGGSYRYNRRDEVLRAVGELNARLKETEIGVTVLPGGDVYIDRNLINLVKEHKVVTVNDAMRYVMVELPSQLTPPNLWGWMHEMALAGYTPILTHPERNAGMLRNREVVREWVERGGLVQVTAMSLTGGFGRKIRKYAEELVGMRLVHILASDGHSVAVRPPLLSKAVKAVSSLIGEFEARKLVEDHPGAIIAGVDIDC
jgi:protein-tyrosine phosphatase